MDDETCMLVNLEAEKCELSEHTSPKAQQKQKKTHHLSKLLCNLDINLGPLRLAIRGCRSLNLRMENGDVCVNKIQSLLFFDYTTCKD